MSQSALAPQAPAPAAAPCCDDPHCHNGMLRWYEAPEPEVGYPGGHFEEPCPFCELAAEDEAALPMPGDFSEPSGDHAYGAGEPLPFDASVLF